MAEKNTIVLIPTLNEQENIKALIPKIFSITPGISILVLDANSPDGTGQAVQELAKKFPNLSLFTRTQSRSFAAGYLAGLNQALARKFRYIITMDADLSHNPKIIPLFLKNLCNYDLIIGSRYVPQGRVRNWELWRRFLSRAGNFYASKVLGMPIHDLTSGFMAINSRNLEKINLKSIRSDGYAFMIELKFHLFRQGARTKEIPIEFVQRKIGNSKISANIIKEGLIMPWTLRLKR